MRDLFPLATAVVTVSLAVWLLHYLVEAIVP